VASTTASSLGRRLIPERSRERERERVGSVRDRRKRKVGRSSCHECSMQKKRWSYSTGDPLDRNDPWRRLSCRGTVSVPVGVYRFLVTSADTCHLLPAGQEAGAGESGSAEASASGIRNSRKKNDASKYVGKMSKRSRRDAGGGEEDGCGSNPEAVPLENAGAFGVGRSGVDCEIFREITQVHRSRRGGFSYLLVRLTFPSRSRSSRFR